MLLCSFNINTELAHAMGEYLFLDWLTKSKKKKITLLSSFSFSLGEKKYWEKFLELISCEYGVPHVSTCLLDQTEWFILNTFVILVSPLVFLAPSLYKDYMTN